MNNNNNNMNGSNGNASSASHSHSHGGASTASGGGNPKMGSRRIFTPHFKLQVLESYRKDADCKGNQRATARKYNIHRRQIQKWLQVESNLRSSVANINQNNVKHQFHNINHQSAAPSTHQHQHPQHQHPHSLPHPVPVANSSGGSPFSHHHHAHLHAPLHAHHLPSHLVESRQLSLDAARQSVALNANSANAPGASPQEVFAAAVVAAIASTSATSTTPSSIVSPLRPTAIAGRSVHSAQQHQHHLYPIPYTHTPANLPISVPVLTHHMPPPLPPLPPSQLHHHHNHQYQYHNLPPHAHTLTHLASSPPGATLASSACLPVSMLVASSATAAMPSAAETTNNAAKATGATDALPAEARSERIRTGAELCETTAATTATPATATTNTDFTGNGYVHCDKYKRACTEQYHHDDDDDDDNHDRRHDNDNGNRNSNGNSNGNGVEGVEYKHKRKYDKSPSYYGFMGDAMPVPNLLCLPATPMDLSVGSRRENGENINCSLRSAYNCSSNNNNSSKCDTDELAKSAPDAVVDLTFRKRKVTEENATTTATPSIELPHKLAKSADDNKNMTPIKIEVVANDNDTNGGGDGDNNNKESNDNYIDVEVAEQPTPTPPPAAKPVKLFKPYLLDNNNDNGHDNATTDCKPSMAPAANEQRAPIIWSNHPSCYSPQEHCHSSNSNFQSPPIDKQQQIFPLGSPYYHGNSCNKSIASPPSAYSYTPISTLSPGSTHCAEGSPVSGYESSTSTYSESSHNCETLRARKARACSLDIQIHAVYDKLNCPDNNVQLWLDQERNDNPPATNASIALYV